VTAELQTANVAYLQRKIQLSRFSGYSDGSPSQLTRISGFLLCKAVLCTFTRAPTCCLHADQICSKLPAQYKRLGEPGLAHAVSEQPAS